MRSIREESPVFENDIYDAISMETCVNRRLTIGAPGKEAMEKVIAGYKEYSEGIDVINFDKKERVACFVRNPVLFHRNDKCASYADTQGAHRIRGE